MQLISTAFENNTSIPPKYTCDGENTNPPLEIRNVPSNAKSLALVIDDPDAPVGNWDHWLLYNIPVETKEIKTGEVLGVQGLNSWNKLEYGGPCPPDREHRYFFKLYALDTPLSFDTPPDKAKLESAMEGRILEQAELVGLYDRER